MSPPVRSLLRSAGLSLLVLVPGLLLNRVSPWLGTIWMLVGSFALVALRYRREWRLNPWTILLPPVATGMSFLVQTLVMRLTLALPFLGAAVVGGGVVGLLRGRTHSVYRKNDGIYAQRSLLYLLIWLVTYAITQLFALARREGLTVIANVAGAFSTAMLVGVAIVLLWRYFRQRGEPGRPLPALTTVNLLVPLLALALTLALSTGVAAQGDDGGEIDVLDQPFWQPQYLIALEGQNTPAGYQELEGYAFFHVAPDENNAFLVPDGAGGVFVTFGSLVSGPFNTPREACAAADGVGETALFFISNNTFLDCAPAVAPAPSEEPLTEPVSDSGEANLGEEAVFVTSMATAITMILTSAGANVLTTIAGTTVSPSAAGGAGPTMVDDTKVVSGSEAIEELVRKGAVRVGDCVTEASLQKILPGIGAIAYQADEKGLVCPDNVSLVRPWRHPDTDPVEKVIPAGTGIAEDMRRIGFQPRIITDKDGRSWIEVSDRTPDNVASIGHVTTKIIDGQGQERTVIDPTAPVIIHHWPGQAPPPPPVFSESDFDGFPPMEDEPELPEFDESDFDDLPSLEDEPEPPEFDESDFDDLPSLEDEPEPPGFDESDFDDLPSLEDEPESPELDEAEAAGDAPDITAEIPELDPDFIRDQLDKMKDKYDELGKGKGWAGIAKQWAVDQLLDKLKSIPPELLPKNINVDQLTDQQIRDMIDNIDPQQLQKDLETLREDLDSLGPLLEAMNVKKEQANEYLDRLERIFASRQTQPVEAQPDRVITPEAISLPTASLGEAVIEEMRQGIVEQYGSYLSDERVRQIANAQIGVYEADEFDTGFQAYQGANDRYAEHTQGFVMRTDEGDPTVVVRSGPDAHGTAYHETLHVASNPNFRGLSHGLNESTTEYFADKVAAPLGIDRSHIPYQSHGGTRLVAEIANKVGEDLLARAFFGDGNEDIMALAQQINHHVQLPEALSDTTPFELLLRMTGDNPPQYDAALQMLRGEGAFAPSGR